MGDRAGHTVCGQDWAGAGRQRGTFDTGSVTLEPGLALWRELGARGRERGKKACPSKAGLERVRVCLCAVGTCVRVYLSVYLCLL